MTTDEFIDFLRQKIKDVGTQTAFARQVGISEQYLSDILIRRKKPGKKLLNGLGFQCVVSYIPLHDAPTLTSRPIGIAIQDPQPTGERISSPATLASSFDFSGCNESCAGLNRFDVLCDGFKRTEENRYLWHAN